MKGHFCSQRIDTQRVITALPLADSDISFRVIITSSYTSAQRAAALRDAVVRQAKVRELLQWLKANNPLYRAITIDQARINALPADAILNAVVGELHEDEGAAAAP